MLHPLWSICSWPTTRMCDHTAISRPHFQLRHGARCMVMPWQRCGGDACDHASDIDGACADCPGARVCSVCAGLDGNQKQLTKKQLHPATDKKKRNRTSVPRQLQLCATAYICNCSHCRNLQPCTFATAATVAICNRVHLQPSQPSPFATVAAVTAICG